MIRTISTINLTAAALAWVLFCTCPLSAGKPQKPGNGGGGDSTAWTIVPFLPPGSISLSSFVSDVNEQGHAVGGNEVASGLEEALHLDLFTGDYTVLQDGTNASGVNNLNQIVGWDASTGLFWASPTARPVALSPLDGDFTSHALRINDAGIIIGTSWNGESGVAVAWRVYPDAEGNLQVDGPVSIPVQLSSDNWAADVNEVNGSETQILVNTGVEAVIWTLGIDQDGTLSAPESPTRVGTLGYQSPSWSNGYGINNFVDVAGMSDGQPYVSQTGQAPQVLSLPRNALYATAQGINDDGQIVGFAAEKFKGGHSNPGVLFAYLWEDGKRISLSSEIAEESGWKRLSRADVISNDGLIGGNGVADVPQRGFVMIPISP